MKRELKVRIFDLKTGFHELKIRKEILKPRKYHEIKGIIELPVTGFTHIVYQEDDKWWAGIIDNKEKFWNVYFE